MKSSKPKVLHEIAGLSLLAHVLAAATAAGAGAIAVVIGPDRADVGAEAQRATPSARVFVQQERLGTAHAVLAAREALAEGADDVIVAFGDTPLVTPEAFLTLRAALAEGADVAVLGFEAQDPAGYGRLLTESGKLRAIREEKDATEAERAVRLCNGGVMALAGRHALALLEAVGNANAKREYYLTDVVAIAHARGLTAVALPVTEEELMGVNDRVQLAAAEARIQQRLRLAAMGAGASLVAPETVFLSHDTRLGRDVVVEPHVVFGPGVVVEEGAVIRSFSHMEKSRIGPGAIVGPFARLRPGADLGAKVHIGNFVEVKNARLAEGVKANHLTYLGDADVGTGTNVGAGTITCNYDGFQKYRTVIGERVFVGTHSSLVAPVSIGDGAYIAAGSVVTDDVPGDALAIGRGRQSVKEGWAKAFRDRRRAEGKR